MLTGKKKMALLLLPVVLLISSGASSQINAQHGASLKPFAVVELFTSQGCSSCPAADRLLSKTISESKLDSGINIFALSFHVDYWNHLGWTDPFSQKEFSKRQNNYASVLNLNSVFTPQMIVNGNRQFVGSNEQSLKDALSRSLRVVPAASFKMLSVTMKKNETASVKFSIIGNYTGCSIHFALLSLRDTTFIKRGENEGLTVISENVVRQFISIPAIAEGEINFKGPPLPADRNLAVVAFLQQNSNLKIIGAAKADINE
jgi:hypothetical protein